MEVLHDSFSYWLCESGLVVEDGNAFSTRVGQAMGDSGQVNAINVITSLIRDELDRGSREIAERAEQSELGGLRLNGRTNGWPAGGSAQESDEEKGSSRRFSKSGIKSG